MWNVYSVNAIVKYVQITHNDLLYLAHGGPVYAASHLLIHVSSPLEIQTLPSWERVLGTPHSDVLFGKSSVPTPIKFCSPMTSDPDLQMATPPSEWSLGHFFPTILGGTSSMLGGGGEESCWNTWCSPWNNVSFNGSTTLSSMFQYTAVSINSWKFELLGL